MKTFKDNAGRTWTVDVNIATVKRVKSLLKVDLTDAVEGKLLDRFILDPILLCDVIYAICKPEADKANITDEQFGYAMSGDAIEHATEALLEELINFFPELNRPALRLARGKFQTFQKKGAEFTMKYLNDPEFEKEMDKELKRIFNLSGSLPGSLE